MRALGIPDVPERVGRRPPAAESLAAGATPHRLLLAQDKREFHRPVEARMTPLFLSMSELLGGRMEKLQFRWKDIDTMAAKVDRINQDRVDDGEPPYTDEEAIASISDALRYTMILPDPAFRAGAQLVINELREQGWRATVKNSIENPTATGYRGVNVSLVDGEGHRFELQFHTEASNALVNEVHPSYKEARNPETPPERRKELFDHMNRLALQIPTPPGGGEIKRAAVTQSGSARYTEV